MNDELKFKVDKKALNAFLGVNHRNYDDFKELEQVLKDHGILLSFNTSYNTFNIKTIKGWNYSIVLKIDNIKVLDNKNLIIEFKLFDITISQYIGVKYVNKNILNDIVANNIFKGYINEFGVQLQKLL